MKRQKFIFLLSGFVLSSLVLAACGGARDSEARVATRVAEDRAVAATLTAEAAAAGEEIAQAATATEDSAADETATPTPIAATVVPAATPPTEPTVAPTFTPTPIVADTIVIAADATATFTPFPTATPTPSPTPSATAAPPTSTPTSTPTATPTPIVAAVIPVDGSEGDGREILIGEHGRAVLLPGIAAAGSPVIFDDFLTARVAVFDNRLPDKSDGNGIAGVTFDIVGPQGLYGPVEYSKVESGAAFCLFGGNEALCPALDLNSARDEWPDGPYSSTITIVANEDGLESRWFWQFCVRTCDEAQTQPEPQTEPQPEAPTAPPSADELFADLAQIGPGSTATTVSDALAFQVEAYDPAVGARDGDGIRAVELEIFGPDGSKVYGRTERTAAYCAFAGGEPDCNVFQFQVDSSYWPDTNNIVRRGEHLLRATIFAEDGRTVRGEAMIEIQ